MQHRRIFITILGSLSLLVIIFCLHFDASLKSFIVPSSSPSSISTTSTSSFTSSTTLSTSRRRQTEQEDENQLTNNNNHSSNHHHHHSNNNNSHFHGPPQKVLFPLFDDYDLDEYRRDQAAIGGNSWRRKHENWQASHPVPRLPKCDRGEDVKHLEPIFFNDSDKAIVTIHSINFTTDSSSQRRVMQRASLISLVHYCKKNRVDLVVATEEDLDHSKPPHWSKMRILRKWMNSNKYKFIQWLDMDVIIMNSNYSMEAIVAQREAVIDKENRDTLSRAKQQFDKVKGVGDIKRIFAPPVARPKPHVIIGVDFGGLNSGIIILRNANWTKNFLKRLASIPREVAKPFHDQGAFLYLLIGGRKGRLEEDAADDRRYVDQTDSLNKYSPATLVFSPRGTSSSSDPNIWRDKPVNDFFVHFANMKSVPSAYVLKWVEYMEQRAGCDNHYARLHANFTMKKPFYRTDIPDAVAPELDEVLTYPTQLRQYQAHNPRVFYFEQEDVVRKRRQVEQDLLDQQNKNKNKKNKK